MPEARAMAAVKVVRTSDSDDDNVMTRRHDDATTQRRDNANDADDDADAGEHDADKDEDKEDGGGQYCTADWQIHQPVPPPPSSLTSSPLSSISPTDTKRAIESPPQSPAWSRPSSGDAPLDPPPPTAAHEAAQMLLGAR
jgi:hypothetical protein